MLSASTLRGWRSAAPRSRGTEAMSRSRRGTIVHHVRYVRSVFQQEADLNEALARRNPSSFKERLRERLHGGRQDTLFHLNEDHAPASIAPLRVLVERINQTYGDIDDSRLVL